MALAIFDLDNTLIAGDSDHRWGEFLVEKGIVDAALYQKENDRFYQDYQRGELDIRSYLAFALKPLASTPLETLNSLHHQFMEEAIAPMWQTQAEALLEKHRQAGDFILIITSTNRFVVEPICKKLGVDDLIATEPEMIDGRYTGNIVGEPSYQKGKIIRLNEWLENHPHSMEGASFYSDSINDLPLLEIVDRPVAVDPCAELRSEAEKHGWEIISLRD